jgi:hypothetical protein
MAARFSRNGLWCSSKIIKSCPKMARCMPTGDRNLFRAADSFLGITTDAMWNSRIHPDELVYDVRALRICMLRPLPRLLISGTVHQ